MLNLGFHRASFSNFLQSPLVISTAEAPSFLRKTFHEQQDIISPSTLSIHECSFSHCKCMKNGGALFISRVKTQLLISSSSFWDCSSLRQNGEGGALDIENTIAPTTIHFCCFYICHTQSSGQALKFDSSHLNMDMVNFERCYDAPLDHSGIAFDCRCMEQSFITNVNTTGCRSKLMPIFKFTFGYRDSSLSDFQISNCTSFNANLYHCMGKTASDLSTKFSKWNLIRNSIQDQDGQIGQYDSLQGTHSQIYFVKDTLSFFDMSVTSENPQEPPKLRFVNCQSDKPFKEQPEERPLFFNCKHVPSLSDESDLTIYVPYCQNNVHNEPTSVVYGMAPWKKTLYGLISVAVLFGVTSVGYIIYTQRKARAYTETLEQYGDKKNLLDGANLENVLSQ